MKENNIKEKIVLFGAGNVGKSSLNVIDNSRIIYFIDNDKRKDGTYIKNYPVKYFYNISVEELKNYHVIITISRKFLPDAKKQLEKLGIYDYECFSDILRKIGKEKKKNSIHGIDVYRRATEWILSNTIHEPKGCSIVNNSELRLGYPEVTGYYIPSLLRWGFKELAISYVDWLVSVQNDDGGFMDTEGKSPYIFDTAQVLKGLLAARQVLGKKHDAAIMKACNWIISHMNDDGRLVTPDITEWGNNKSLELIHLYCISPLYEAAHVLNIHEIKLAADKIKKYYLENYMGEILTFERLIHFHAYLMEALLDIGEIEYARKGMKSIEHYVDELGYVPAYSDRLWVCSTGLFQLAVVWYRLNNLKYGDKVFDYAVKLQNTTGGWYGSYMTDRASSNEEENDYFPASEISWANKFFMDALYYKLKATSETYAPDFQNGEISVYDGRYKEVEQFIQETYSLATKDSFKILDVGGGNGRYIKNLLIKYPNIDFYVLDISEYALKKLHQNIHQAQGTLTNIPYEDEYFDAVFACESFEHAVDFDNAIKELTRVVKNNGRLLILDKNQEAEGEMETGEWETWPGKEDLLSQLNKYFLKTIRNDNISYDEITDDDTFSAWIGIGKRKRQFNNDIIIAPFCADAVLTYHRFLMDGLKPYTFFDNNPLLKGKKYGDCYVQKMYYRKNTDVIIACSKNTAEKIKTELRSIGYPEENIIIASEIGLDSSEYDASFSVDLKTFCDLRPDALIGPSGRRKIKKLMKMKTLGAPKSYLKFEFFDDEGPTNDNFVSDALEKHVFLQELDLIVTTRCSLRCRKCSNGIPFFEKPEDVAEERVIADYNRMIELIDWVSCLCVIGGEVFLYKNLSRVLEAILDNPYTESKVGEIRLISNGTVLPDEKSLKLMRNSNVTVLISNYPGLSNRVSEMTKLFMDNHIAFDVLHIDHWALINQLEQRDGLPSERDLIDQRYNCHTHCRAVAEGRFYMCFLCYSMEKLHAVPEDKKNYVNIYSHNAKEELYEYMRRDKPMPPCCYWCSGSHDEIEIPVAEQCKGTLPYKKY